MKQLLIALLALGLATQVVAAPTNKELNKKIKALQAQLDALQAEHTPAVGGRKYRLNQIGSKLGGDGAGAGYVGHLRQTYEVKFKNSGVCRLLGEEFESELQPNILTLGNDSGPVDVDCSWTQQGNIVTVNFADEEGGVDFTVSADGSVITLRAAGVEDDGGSLESEAVLLVGVEI